MGFRKTVREIYRHSFFGELYYRTVNLILEDKLIVKKLSGFEMILDISNSGLEKDLFLHGVREKESVGILSEYLEEGMEVVDVGANIGYYTMIQAEIVGDSGLVKAIEPTESSFLRLKKNCGLNEFENIDFINKAVGSESETVQIKERASPNLNRVTDSKDSGNGSVEQEPLDDIIDFDPDAVRMDVQGYETEILKGMEEVLQTDNLMLFIEVHPSKIRGYYGDDITEFWKILSKNDFKVKYLIRHPPKPRPTYFFRKAYPPKKVLKPEMGVEETLENHQDFFDWETAFRVFLEKK